MKRDCLEGKLLGIPPEGHGMRIEGTTRTNVLSLEPCPRILARILTERSHRRPRLDPRLPREDLLLNGSSAEVFNRTPHAG